MKARLSKNGEKLLRNNRAGASLVQAIVTSSDFADEGKVVFKVKTTDTIQNNIAIMARRMFPAAEIRL